mmetsp:Transcript_19455/g.38684  ORF Transcript_19455/g.38684 Transcript_19455/m.38684 type:complete len:455 (-) Transcript_19455:244-1608(-)
MSILPRLRKKLCLVLCLAQVFRGDGYCFVSHSEDVPLPNNILLVPCPSKHPSLPPTNRPTRLTTAPSPGPTPACHDVGNFVTKVTLGSAAAKRTTCKSLRTLGKNKKSRRDRICGLDVLFENMTRPVKMWCPQACGYDCDSHSSASPSYDPSSIPSKSDGPSSLPSFSPSNEPSTMPSNRPTFRCNVEPQVRSNEISEYISSKITNTTTLEDDSSPESAALNWIIADDGRYLCSGDDHLIQRYVSALFYFAAGGPAWIKSDGFLSSDDECKWSGIECNMGGNIEELNLDDNNLKGTLPPELYHLEDLTTLNFDGTKNSLSGTIPNTFGNLLNLLTIDLDKNNLEGTLPASIFALKKLEVLDIDSNLFSGTLSAAIGNLTSLISIQLHNNRFTGTVPLEVRNLVDLSTFTIYDNEFTGSIQDDICDLEIDSLVADCAGQPPKISCDCCIKCFPDF